MAIQGNGMFIVQSQGGFLCPTFNVVGESLKYCVVMILMAIDHVRVYAGDARNIKITTHDDLLIAETLLRRRFEENGL